MNVEAAAPGAQPPEPTPPYDEAAQDEMSGQYVSFYIEEECFAFPMRSVLEIIRVPEAIRVPLTPRSLIGLANLRGSVLPVIDLRRTLGMAEAEQTDASRAVVADCGTPIGLVVDRVARVLTVEADQIVSADRVRSTIDTSLLTGVVKKGTNEGGLIQLLDVAQIVSQEFPETLEAAVALQATDGTSLSALSEAQKALAEEDDTIQLVSFFVDGQEYAFEINDVAEIVRIPEAINKVPRAGHHVLGLISLRERLLPLVSLRRMFELSESDLNEQSRILVVHLGETGESVGIVVDQVREVLRAAPDVKDQMPSLLSQGDALNEITTICRLENGKRLVSVLSSAALFHHPAVQEAVSIRREEEGEDVLSEDHEAQGDEGHGEDEETQLVVFHLVKEEYGVTIDSVQEIIRVPEEMSRVPKTPDFIEGLINLRGTVLPVLDMRTRFGLDRAERHDRQRILVLSVEGTQTGFIVDSVTEVLRLSQDVIETAPYVSEDQARVMGRVANLKDSKRMILTLNVGELLEEGERREIERGLR